MKNLGKKAKDKVTGFEGIIIGKINYLTGCDQYGIVAPVKKGEATKSAEWFDVHRVLITGPGVKINQVSKKSDPGGISRDAPKG